MSDYSVWKYVRSDLRRALLSVPGLPGDAKWEGKRYRPTAGIPWFSERIQPGSSITETLGAHGMTSENAIYMIDLYWPSTGALSDVEDLADDIRGTFWHGREIGSSGPMPIKGSVLASERMRAVEGDTWIEIPVRIEFFVRRYTRPSGG